MYVIKRKTKGDDLGEDTVFTSADLKVIKNQIIALQKQAEDLKKEVKDLENEQVPNDPNISGQLPSLDEDQAIKSALEEIEVATYKK